MVTIREAMRALLNVCDGAQQKDYCGYNYFDGIVIRDIAQVPEGSWTEKQQSLVLKILAKYQKQLQDMGITYQELTREPERIKGEAPQQRSTELSLDLQDGRLVLTSPFEFKDQAKAIPGHRWAPEIKKWTYTINAETLRAFQPYIQDGSMKVSQAVSQLYSELASKAQNIQDAQVHKKQVPADLHVPLKEGIKLYDHQMQGVAFGLHLMKGSRGAVAYLMEQGTGKTLTDITLIGELYLQGKVRRLLVVCPKSITFVWADEFASKAAFPVEVQVLSGSIKEKIAQVKAFTQLQTQALKVLVVNYDSTWRDGLTEALQAYNADFVTLDESQKIKNASTKQSKACHQLGKKAPFKSILTGTPVSQAPLDFFSQYKFLDPDIFGNSFARYRDQYCIMGGYGGHEIIGWREGALEEIARKAHSIAFRCKKEDCLDLPETVDQVIYTTLEDSQKVYNQMHDEMTALLEGQEKVTAPIVISQMLRLQQITGGFLPVHDEFGKLKEYKQIGNEKLETLRELVEDMTDKAVIVCRFTPEVQHVAAMLREMGRKTVTLDGSTQDRGAVVKQFQEDPSTQFIVLQIQTGGVGITLHAAATMIFYSMDFSYSNLDQVRARIHRIGQTRKCTYIFLVALQKSGKQTIDGTVLKALQSKKDVADLVVDQLKDGAPSEGALAKVGPLFIEHDPEPEISFEEADLLSVLADVRRGTA